MLLLFLCQVAVIYDISFVCLFDRPYLFASLYYFKSNYILDTSSLTVSTRTDYSNARNQVYIFSHFVGVHAVRIEVLWRRLGCRNLAELDL